jgi:hypothetical protein
VAGCISTTPHTTSISQPARANTLLRCITKIRKRSSPAPILRVLERLGQKQTPTAPPTPTPRGPTLTDEAVAYPLRRTVLMADDILASK